MVEVLRLLPSELDAVVGGMRVPRFRADQILHGLYRELATNMDEIRVLPDGLRSRLRQEGYTVGPAERVREVVSNDGATTKLLLRMRDGQLIETVLMQYPEPGDRHPRSTVCVSTQAGCAMGCVFCATGQMGFERNLKAEEIVGQVIEVARVLRTRGQHVTNVVFMGMGEPLANYAETIRAVRLLTDPRAFGLGQRNITISTVGLIHGIDRLADEDLQVGLAISLHAPNEELRQRLVPTAGPTSVHDLMSAARRYFKKTGRRVTLEYALMADENDSPGVAQQLAELVRGTGMHVNVIPVNPTAGGFRRPPRARVLEFERILKEAGINVTVRVEKGTEISAACGQLRTDTAAESTGYGTTRRPSARTPASRTRPSTIPTPIATAERMSSSVHFAADDGSDEDARS
jgi:23S rRNA (adenine2503-C2)-methyltransferase